MQRIFAVSAALALMLVAGVCRASTMESLESGGFNREFYIHLPPGYQSGHPMPLVIVYHGSGDTGAGIEEHVGLDAVADKVGFIAVYPDGIDRVWASQVADQADAAGVDDVVFTAAMLDKLEQEYSIEKQHVIAVGFSNGAHLVHLLGCQLADRLTAIVPIGGTLSTAVQCHPTRPITVVEFHDAHDPVVSYMGGRVGMGGAARAWPATNGIWNWAVLDKCHTPASEARFPVTSAEPVFFVDDFPGCSDAVKVRLYTLFKGIHAWPQIPDANNLIGEIVMGRFK